MPTPATFALPGCDSSSDAPDLGEDDIYSHLAGQCESTCLDRHHDTYTLPRCNAQTVVARAHASANRSERAASEHLGEASRTRGAPTRPCSAAAPAPTPCAPAPGATGPLAAKCTPARRPQRKSPANRQNIAGNKDSSAPKTITRVQAKQGPSVGEFHRNQVQGK